MIILQKIDYEGIDFKSDLQKLEEVHKRMAASKLPFSPKSYEVASTPEEFFGS